MKLILILIFTVLNYLALAQEVNKGILIKGCVKDSNSRTAVQAKVRLLNSGFKVVDSITTDNLGCFSIERSPYNESSYITVESTFFLPKTIPLKALINANGIINLGDIHLLGKVNLLNDVSIVKKRNIFKQTAEGIVYDVQSDPESRTKNLLDLFKKIPYVTVDIRDNIKLKGGTNFKVLINGQASQLTSRNPSDVLRALPGSTIKKVEVITVPSSKYEAEGVDGIINIITSKKIADGFILNTNVSYNNVYGPNSTVSLVSKRKRFGWNLAAGLGGMKQRIIETDGMRFSEDNGRQINIGSSKEKANYHSITNEFSYEIDSVSFINASVAYSRSKRSKTDSSITNVFTGNNLIQTINYQNLGNFDNRGVDITSNYQTKFKKEGKNQLNVAYKYSTYGTIQTNDLNYRNGIGNQNDLITQYNDTRTNEHTGQIDFERQGRLIKIEAGAISIFRRNSSTGDEQTNSSSLSGNSYQQRQNVLGFYNAYGLEKKTWSFKIGARLELTGNKAEFNSSENVDQHYSSFIPSVSVQKKLTESSGVSLAYTQRIERPGIWKLNPFIDKSDPQLYITGNVNLKPVKKHVLEFNFGNFGNGYTMAGLNFSYSNNTIQYITEKLDNIILISSFANIGKTFKTGATFTISKPLGKKININLDGELARLWFKGVVEGQQFETSGFQGSTSLNIDYEMAKNIRLSLLGGYNSSTISLQQKNKYYPYTTLSVRKEMFKSRGILSMYVSNPFKKYFTATTQITSLSFEEAANTREYYRSLGVSFNFKFGGLKGGLKKADKSVDNLDVEKQNDKIRKQ